MRSTSTRLPADLAAARTRIEKWRSTGRARRPLPKRIWKMAADLVPIHGVCRVSRVLRLEYYKVKERAEKRQTERQTKAKPTFVQMSSPPPGILNSAFGCTVEITDKNGRQMTIQSTTTVDIGGLVAAFCGAAR